MEPIDISINPTYLCNFRCKSCYLTPEQLGDKTQASLDTIWDRLAEVEQHRHIRQIDLYGGEISLLPPDYLEKLRLTIQSFTDNKISVITNFYRDIPFFHHEDVDLSVSWDYHCRERWQDVLANILMSESPIHLLILANKCVISWDEEDLQTMIDICDNFAKVVSAEIKPYSTNQANCEPVLFTDFETFVRRWINKSPESKRNYQFVNETKIQQSLAGKANAWSDDHVYITPSGKFGVLEFDESDNEFFLELDTFDEYLEWTQTEVNRVKENKFCSECPYLGTCLSEHLRDVKSLKHSCNGFRHLLDWYGKPQTSSGDVS